MSTIALIGAGSIGISFAALYLKHSTSTVKLYDPRADLDQHIRSVLPIYLDSSNSTYNLDLLIDQGRLKICASLREACTNAGIVQEQGPEKLSFKVSIWTEIANLVSLDTHFWSSTSGIPASKQADRLSDAVKQRLMVVHPFNPPHIMPLLELVPSPFTRLDEVEFAKRFFQDLNSGHQPVVVRKEVPGFVGNRLAFVLLREACHLVAQGVVSVKDLDIIVEASLGPRWAVTGPFKSYHYGGGVKGLGAFFDNLSSTIEDIWQDAGRISFAGTGFPKNEQAEQDQHTNAAMWPDEIVRQTKKAYGLPTTADFAKRDHALKTLLRARGI